jgi:hypothetical protein
MEAGHVIEPPDQRLEFFLFFLCFVRGFFVTYMRCSRKCAKGLELLVVHFWLP